jgi:hypothetical protein
MHVERRSRGIKRRKGTPLWALNDRETRRIVLTFLERRYSITPPPDATDLQRLAAIDAAAKAKAGWRQQVLERRLDEYKNAADYGVPEKRLRELQIEAQVNDSRALFDRKPAQLLNAVIYLSYRRGLSSRAVAEELQMLPPHVRILLYRLNRLAEDLQSGRERPMYGKHEKQAGARRRQRRRWTPERLEALWKLRSKGHSYTKCGKLLGLSHGAVLAAYTRSFMF